MTANAIKKSRADTAGVLRRVSPASFAPDAIEEAIDLGQEGYVLVKLHAPPARAARQRGVAAADVKRLLDRLMGCQGPDDIIEEDNSVLIAQLENDAMVRRAALHAQGQLLDSAGLCARLGISRQALSKAVRDKRMFRVDGSGGAHWYPGFFVAGRAHRRDIEQVSMQLGDLPGDVKWHFFTTPKYSLEERTPLEALNRGEVERVMRSAAEYRERNLGR